MKYGTLASTGIQVSRIAFGCSSYGSKDWMPWALSEEEAQDHYRCAFEAGFNFFDTADSYSSGLSEEILGRAVKRFAGGRDQVVIATKVFFATGAAPIRKDCRASTSGMRSTTACAGLAPTMSISTRSIVSIP